VKACPLCRGRGYYDRWSVLLGDPADHMSRWLEDEHSPLGGRNEAGELIDVAPEGCPYWVPGAEVDLVFDEDDATRFVERSPCAECERRRQAFADKRDGKNDRRRERASKLTAQADADQERSRNMLPYGGEPIKIGHHSEKRHRRDLEKSHGLMRRSIDQRKDAEHLERLADASESSRAVSSDDPDAIMKLRESLAEHEAKRERIKAHNRAAKKAGKPIADAYVLTNLGANIRRIKARITELERAAVATTPDDVEIGECRIEWDAEANRMRLYSPDPGPAGRKARSQLMRGYGFIWSLSNRAWQRQASRTAWDWARIAAQKISEGSP
jgi:hypothetical protein